MRLDDYIEMLVAIVLTVFTVALTGGFLIGVYFIIESFFEK